MALAGVVTAMVQVQFLAPGLGTLAWFEGSQKRKKKMEFKKQGKGDEQKLLFFIIIIFIFQSF